MTMHASGIYFMIHNIFAFMLNAGRLSGGKETRMTIANTSDSLLQYNIREPESIGCDDEQSDLFLFRRPTLDTLKIRERMRKK